MLNVSKKKAIQRLESLLVEGKLLSPELGHTRQLQKWNESVRSAFIYIFGEDSRQYSRLPDSYTISPSGIRIFLDAIISVVESNLEDIEHFWDGNGGVENKMVDQIRSMSPDFRVPVEKKLEKKIFIVHGHDVAFKESVARFLESLNFETIILHEQSDKGRTIIEKMEDHSDVGFAVVLMTPDDQGATKSEVDRLQYRARQNVIFELGFFIGRLGRNYVCALKSPEVEIPSDYDGVIYINLDGADGWKIKLTRELKTVGFEIDTNSVF